MSKNVLVFEGAGWDKADSSILSGVGNCRIRTRIRNIDGRVIYLELGGTKFEGKNIPEWAKGLNYTGRVDHCFYNDSEWDSNRSHSRDLLHLQREHFEYNKETILQFVNNKLNCSFDSLEVINDNSISVHDTNNPLCDCSKPEYVPFKEIKFNISELEDITPIVEHKKRGFAQYKISYKYIKEQPYLKKWMQERSPLEQLKFENYNYYVAFRWDQAGIITSAEVSARQVDFCNMGLGAEDLQNIIDEIKTFNKSA